VVQVGEPIVGFSKILPGCVYRVATQEEAAARIHEIAKGRYKPYLDYAPIYTIYRLSTIILRSLTLKFNPQFSRCYLEIQKFTFESKHILFGQPFK
jgi:hypothetical protein